MEEIHTENIIRVEFLKVPQGQWMSHFGSEIPGGRGTRTRTRIGQKEVSECVWDLRSGCLCGTRTRHETVVVHKRQQRNEDRFPKPLNPDTESCTIL